MKARDLMTANPCCCTTTDTIQDVARLMRDNDCGSIPVVDAGGCMVGTVTDRDLTVRALAEGKSPTAHVATVMTPDPCCCSVDADLADVERTMADNQIRRVPVVNADGTLVGIVAQADLARAAENRRVSEHEIALVVEAISEPARSSSRASAEQSEQSEQRL